MARLRGHNFGHFLIGFRSFEFGPIEPLTRSTGGTSKRNLLYLEIPRSCISQLQPLTKRRRQEALFQGDFVALKYFF